MGFFLEVLVFWTLHEVEYISLLGFFFISIMDIAKIAWKLVGIELRLRIQGRVDKKA